MTPTTPTRSRPRYLRFSVRTLLVMLTLFCVWLGWKAQRARTQREVVAWVHEMGGSVYYDYEIDGKNGTFVSNPQPPGPDWLRELLGVEFLDEIVEVRIRKSVADISPLSKLKSLEWLCMTNHQVTDLSPLRKLTNLKRLELYSRQVSDLEPLAELTNLEILALDNTQVSDLSPIAELTKLRELSVRYSKVRDASPLAKLKSVERMHLRYSHVPREEVEELRKALPNCRIDWSRPRTR